jgi:dihydroneopterin aldolase
MFLAHDGAATTDALTDTVDYATLCDDISAIVAGEPVALLERLARLVADRALADPAVRAATVTIAKPHVAIPHVVDDVSVSLHAVADGS